MQRMKRWYALGMLLALALPLVLAFPSAAMAAGPTDVVISTPYPWVVTEKGKAITFVLTIDNKGTAYADMDLQIADGPKEWKPVLKDQGFSIRKVTVAPGKQQILNFQAAPPIDAKASDYGFLLKGVGSDGTVLSSLPLKVTLEDKVGGGLDFSTAYPSQRGQAGTTFGFKMDLTNNANEDRPVNFSASSPEEWEVSFKPGYEGKQTQTMRMKGGENQSVDVDIKPPSKIEAGDYNVKVTASAGTDRVEVPLKITVLGYYKISLNTDTGNLNTKATVDEPASLTLVVRNTGASTLQGVSLASNDKPDGWDVTFDPDKIDAIPPEQARTVQAKVKPGSRTLAGDYMVGVTVSTSQATDNKSLRVSVDTPTTWGWAGIAVIVAVLGGLGLLFTRLSRR